MKRFAIIIFFCFLPNLLGCATKLELESGSLFLSSEQEGNPYADCNIFSNNAFFGRIFPVPNSDTCFDIYVEKHSSDLFSEDLALQIYPFRLGGENGEAGKPVPLLVVSKKDNIAHIKSEIIDLSVIRILQSSEESFFEDYYLKACDVDAKDYPALMFVVFLHGSKKPKPISRTQALLPPFLADADEFTQENGAELAVYHPLRQDTDSQIINNISKPVNFSRFLCSQ